MSGEKRSRAPNYTPDDKIYLLNIISQFKAVVKNKKTDGITWREKEEAWLKITNQFNASSPFKRSVESVKAFFENQKRQCHKKAAILKKSMCGTGGGPPQTPKEDPLSDMTLDIISPKTVFGLDPSCGGDSKKMSQPSSFISTDELIMKEVENFDVDNYYADTLVKEAPQTESRKSVIAEDHNYSDNVQATAWKSHTPKSLQRPIHKKLTNTHNYTMKVDHLSPGVSKRSRQCTEAATADDWSIRRRPSATATISVARKYEDLCSVKTELAQTQMRIAKAQEEHQLQTIKMDLEERKVRQAREKELFEIELAIKKAQLHQLQK